MDPNVKERKVTYSPPPHPMQGSGFSWHGNFLNFCGYKKSCTLAELPNNRSNQANYQTLPNSDLQPIPLQLWTEDWPLQTFFAEKQLQTSSQFLLAYRDCTQIVFAFYSLHVDIKSQIPPHVKSKIITQSEHGMNVTYMFTYCTCTLLPS